MGIGDGRFVLDQSAVSLLRGKGKSRSTLGKIASVAKSLVGYGNKASTPPAEASVVTAEPVDTTQTYVLKYDENGSNFDIADCCCPIPGD